MADNVSQAPDSSTVPFLDTHGVPQDVPVASLAQADAAGWKQVGPETADHAAKVIAAQKDTGTEAFTEGALRGFLPFASSIESGLGGPGKEQQQIEQEAHPGLSTSGEVAGNVGQIAAIIASDGLLGPVAEGAKALEAAPKIFDGAKIAKSALTFGAQGAANELNEEDLGDKGFNAEAIANAGGKGAILGAVSEPVFGTTAKYVPKLIRAGADLTTKLTDATSDAIATMYSKAAPAVEGVGDEAEKAAAKDIYNTVQEGGKAQDVPVKAANKLADTLNDSIENGWDKIQELNKPDGYLQGQAKNLIGQQPNGESYIIAGLNNFGENTVKPFVRQMELSVENGEFAPAMAKTIRGALKDFDEATLTADGPADLQRAGIKLRQEIDPVLRYGKTFTANSLDGTSAAAIEEHLQTPLRELLKNQDVWGQPLADAHSKAMAAEKDFFDALSALNSKLGGKDLLAGGARPSKEIKPYRILSMLRGEGTNLNQIENANILKNFSGAFENLQKVAEEAADNAKQTISKDDVPNLLKQIKEQHEQGVASAKLGTSHPMWEQGGSQLGFAAALLGHPALGAAGLAAKGILQTVSNPKGAMTVLGTISKIATQHQAAIGKGAAAFLKGIVKPVATVSALNSNHFSAGRSSLPREASNYDKRTDEIKNLMSNPTKLQNVLAANTAQLTGVAPGHALAIHQAALARLQTVAQAIPPDDNQSMLPGPKLPPNPDQVGHFERVFSAAVDPVESIYTGMSNGTLTQDTIEAVQQSNPKTYQAIVTALNNEIVDNPKRTYTYSQKVMLSMVLGQAVSPEVSDDQTQFQQTTFQATSPAPVNGNPGGTNKTRVKGLDELKLAQNTKTAEQKRQTEES